MMFAIAFVYWRGPSLSPRAANERSLIAPFARTLPSAQQKRPGPKTALFPSQWHPYFSGGPNFRLLLATSCSHTSLGVGESTIFPLTIIPSASSARTGFAST